MNRTLFDSKKRPEMKSLQLMDDNSVSDSVGEESGVLTADLLAACKNNDTKRAQDLLANGILPDYSEPESGERGQLLRVLLLSTKSRRKC